MILAAREFVSANLLRDQDLSVDTEVSYNSPPPSVATPSIRGMVVGKEKLPEPHVAFVAWNVAELKASLSDQERLATEEAVPIEAHASLEIAGERFYLELEDGLVYLQHPTWSLLGYGETLEEAVSSLYTDARELAEVFLEFEISTLSYDAFRMRDFLHRVV